jgi:hypothetical protein
LSRYKLFPLIYHLFYLIVGENNSELDNEQRFHFFSENQPYQWIKILQNFKKKKAKAKVRIRTGVVMLCRHLRSRSATLALVLDFAIIDIPKGRRSDNDLGRGRPFLQAASPDLNEFHSL